MCGGASSFLRVNRFTDSSDYAYFGVCTQAVEILEHLGPAAFTLGTFLEMQQRWSATEKKAYAVYQSMLKFDLYFRGAKCVLHCDHKPLEPFYLQVIKFLSSTGGLWN